MGKEGKAWRGGYAGCRLDLYREQGHGENAHRRGSSISVPCTGAAMGTDGERPWTVRLRWNITIRAASAACILMGWAGSLNSPVSSSA